MIHLLDSISYTGAPLHGKLDALVRRWNRKNHWTLKCEFGITWTSFCVDLGGAHKFICSFWIALSRCPPPLKRHPFPPIWANQTLWVAFSLRSTIPFCSQFLAWKMAETFICSDNFEHKVSVVVSMPFVRYFFTSRLLLTLCRRIESNCPDHLLSHLSDLSYVSDA